MAFLAPIAAAIAGLSTLGTALLQVGLSLAIGFAARKLTPKPDKGFGGSRNVGTRVDLKVATDAPREFIFGEAGTAGQLVYWQLSGSGNKVLDLVIALASHESEELVGIKVNGEDVTWNSGTGQTTEFGNKLTILFFDGSQTEASPTLVSASNGRIASTDAGIGQTYVHARMVFDESKFPKGIPEFIFRVKGAKVYDRRKDSTAGGTGAHRFSDRATWEYSDNPAVITQHLLRGFEDVSGQHLVGLQSPEDAVRYTDYASAANACEEAVGIAAGGTEDRYRCGIVADCDTDNREVIEAVLASMAGELVHTGGVYRIMAGVSQAVVATITDADLIPAEPFVETPKLPRSELINAVQGSHSSEDVGFRLKPLPARTSSAAEAEDGGRRYSTLVELPTVLSNTQAQRIMEIVRRRARYQLTVKVTVRGRWSVLEAGDWIVFNSDRRGYVSRTFEIENRRLKSDHRVELLLREVDANIDDWIPANDELADSSQVDLGSAAPATATLTLTSLAAIEIEAANGEKRPGLQVQWTPPDDPTYIEILLQYRKVGDSVILERRIFNAEQGAYTWLDGVQGGIAYEARLLPITRPERAATYTNWVAIAGNTEPQVVGQAAGVADGTVTVASLDPQAAFQIGLTTAAEEVQGSVAEQIARVMDYVSLIAETAQTDRVLSESNRRQLRADLDGVTATVDENLQVVVDDVTGIKAQYSLVLGLNGEVVAFQEISGDSQSSDFIIGATRFAVVDPNVNGGTPIDLFTVASIEGTPKVFINGELIANAITAGTVNVSELAAITATLGSVQAGEISSPDGSLYIKATDPPEITLTTVTP